MTVIEKKDQIWPKSGVEGSQEIRSFITWLREEHRLTLACLHIHQSTCYGEGKRTCSYPQENLHPVCADEESVLALFVRSQEKRAPAKPSSGTSSKEALLKECKNSMDHKQAIESYAVEAYVLGELKQLGPQCF